MAIDKDSLKKQNARKVYQKAKEKSDVKKSSDISLSKSEDAATIEKKIYDGKSSFSSENSGSKPIKSGSFSFEKVPATGEKSNADLKGNVKKYEHYRKKKFRKAAAAAEKFKHTQDGSNEDTAYESLEVYKGSAKQALKGTKKLASKSGKEFYKVITADGSVIKGKGSIEKTYQNISQKSNMLSSNTSSGAGKKLTPKQKKKQYKKNRNRIYKTNKNKAKKRAEEKNSLTSQVKKKAAQKMIKWVACVFSFLMGNWMLLMPIVLILSIAAGGEAYNQSRIAEYTYPASDADITQATTYWQALQVEIKSQFNSVPSMDGVAGHFDEKKSSVCTFMNDNNALLSFISAYYIPYVDAWHFDDAKELIEEVFYQMYAVSYSIKPEKKTITETKIIPEANLPVPLPSTYTILSKNGTDCVVKISEVRTVNILEYKISEKKSWEDILNEYLDAEQMEKYQNYYEHKGGAIKAFSSPFAFDWAGYITSPFGYRDWGGGNVEFHKGVDFGVPHGTEELAIADGTVVKICNTCTHDYPKDGSCGCGGGYGNYVDILTDDGQYYITYGHMADIYVSVGDTIKNGQVIGTAGCTGWSTGNHLHLEMRLGSEQGELIDPQTFIRGYVPIEETQEENQ